MRSVISSPRATRPPLFHGQTSCIRGCDGALTPREQELSQWALGHATNLLPDRRRRFLSSFAG